MSTDHVPRDEYATVKNPVARTAAEDFDNSARKIDLVLRLRAVAELTGANAIDRWANRLTVSRRRGWARSVAEA